MTIFRAQKALNIILFDKSFEIMEISLRMTIKGSGKGHILIILMFRTSARGIHGKLAPVQKCR